MQNRPHILLVVFMMVFALAKAQDTPIVTAETVEPSQEIDPLQPARVAFYSAALPGLGQAYNKDYWKIPIVYGALGTGVYFAVDNHNEFQRYRTAFKERLAGRVDEFSIVNVDGSITEVISDDGLIDAQDFFRRRKELSILISAGMYVLQIIEANVDAHLSQYNVDENLTFAPDIHPDDLGYGLNYGFKFTYHID